MARREKKPFIPETGPVPPGSIIRARRVAIDMSRESLAHKAGHYSAEYIRQIETGIEKPSEQFLSDVAYPLGFDSVTEMLESSPQEVNEWWQAGKANSTLKHRQELRQYRLDWFAGFLKWSPYRRYLEAKSRGEEVGLDAPYEYFLENWSEELVRRHKFPIDKLEGEDIHPELIDGGKTLKLTIRLSETDLERYGDLWAHLDLMLGESGPHERPGPRPQIPLEPPRMRENPDDDIPGPHRRLDQTLSEEQTIEQVESFLNKADPGEAQTNPNTSMQVPQRLHFIGIGGSRMSAIAKVLLEDGYSISGSDLKASALTDKLAALGASIFEGHAEANVGAAEMIVYSSAVPQDNPELREGLRRGIPVIKRADMLGWLMSKQDSIAVVGTHGKTTTSSLISLIALDAGLDPTILVGGELANLDTNARAGKGRLLVAEGDEFDGTFLKLRPKLAVVTNIEPDHLDYYGTFENMVDAFAKFMDSVPDDGHIVACLDDEKVRSFVASAKGGRRMLTYGLESGAEWQATNISLNGRGGHDFRAEVGGRVYGEFSLAIPGRHNVSNALAAIVVANLLGISTLSVRQSLLRFQGARRRFEWKGGFRGIPVIDDYAHHPTEVRASLRAAHERFPGRRLVCVFQPHTFSRTKYLLAEFATCFDDADLVIIADVYASGERDTLGISSTHLASAMRHPNAHQIGPLEKIAEWLSMNLEENDVLLTLGAGDVGKVGELVIEYGEQP